MRPYSSLAGLRTAILVLLGVHVVAELHVLIPVDPDGPLVATDIIVAVAALLSLAVVITIAVLSIILWHRAHRNAATLGAHGLRWSPGWAVGSWFIPVANLVLPFLVLREAWRASDPRRPTVGTAWQANRLPAWVGIWWAFFLLSNIAGVVWGEVDYTSAANLPLAVAYLALLVPAAGLYGLVVSRLSRNQDRLAARMGVGTGRPGHPGTVPAG